MTGAAPATSGFMRGGMSVLSRHLGLGIAGAAATFTIGMFGGRFWWGQLPGFLPVAITLALSGWACHRVWTASLHPLLHGAAGWKAGLSRIPFWFMAGGMGTVAGLLIAKEYGMLDFPDVPVKPFFTSGAGAYTAVQLVATLVAGAFMKRKFR
jgi:hypothetical protein